MHWMSSEVQGRLKIVLFGFGAFQSLGKNGLDLDDLLARRLAEKTTATALDFFDEGLKLKASGLPYR